MLTATSPDKRLELPGTNIFDPYNQPKYPAYFTLTPLPCHLNLTASHSYLKPNFILIRLEQTLEKTLLCSYAWLGDCKYKIPDFAAKTRSRISSSQATPATSTSLACRQVLTKQDQTLCHGRCPVILSLRRPNHQSIWS